MADFLHGVETLDVDHGGVTVRTVKSAVIGLIGTAPKGEVNVPTLVLSKRDAAQFGDPAYTEFTIADALADIALSGAGTVVVINVLDPAIHKTTVPDEEATFDPFTGRAVLRHPAVSAVVVKSKDGATTYEPDVDYVLDPDTGGIVRTFASAMPLMDPFTVTYTYADPSKITATDIIGKVDEAGQRSGIQALEDLYSRFGFTAKILIAPVFETQATVSTALVAAMEREKAVGYISAPAGITPQQAVEGRGPLGSINFNTSSRRARLLYPFVEVADPRTGGTRLKSLSALAAGVRARVDQTQGFWYSNSNHEIPGVLGLERPISARLDDPQSETNLLNAAGITTVFNSFGTGFRLWGNRNAAYPTEGGLKSFESVIRTKDMIDESIRVASLPFIDQPMSLPLLESIVESVNAYGRKMYGDGAVLGFNAWINPDRNPISELADGNGRVSYKFTPPPSLERLTYESEITDEYLIVLTGGQA